MLGLGNLLTKGGAVIQKFPNEYSFNFDGSNDYLSLDLFDIDLSEDWSISLWMNPDTTSGTQYIFTNTKNSSNRLGIQISNGTLIFGTYNGSSYTGKSGSISASTWTHVLATITNNTLALYINGVAQSGTSTPSLSSTSATRIGIKSDSSSSPYNGKLDEFAIWSVLLSSDDATKIASKPVDFSKASTYATDRTANLKLWLRAGDKVLPEEDTSIARSDFYTDFDGTNDYVDCGDDTSLDITSTITISGWVYLNQVNESCYIIGREDGAVRNYILFAHSDGKFYFQINISSSTKSVGSTTTYVANRWYM
jgi:hypothetical protein